MEVVKARESVHLFCIHQRVLSPATAAIHFGEATHSGGRFLTRTGWM